MRKVKDVMTKKVVTVNIDSTVQKICSVLSKNKLSGVPVVDKNGRLTGFISERDIITSVDKKDFLSRKASKLMTKKVFFVKEEMPAEEASRIFTEKPFRYVPVLKNKRVVGIISRKDVISRMLGQYY